jgi:pectate lyase
VVTGYQLWIDHCTFTDGRFPDSEAPVGLQGKHVQRHDGLLDIEDGSDFVTVSHSVFEDHDKTMLVGSGDSRADRDRGHLRITFHANLFRNSLQRSPRVRFGEVHAYNNVFEGSVRDADYPMTSEALGGHHYFLGMGLESKLVSEYNVFRYDGRPSPEDVTVINFKGNTFVDRGSWVNGRRADLNAVAARKYAAASAAAVAEAEAAGTAAPEWAVAGFSTDVGWDPAEKYDYRPLRNPAAITASVLRGAGAAR